MAPAISINDQDVLLAIDLQADFMPGGALAVDRGNEIVSLVNRLARRFESVVITQDWHPPTHASFAAAHEGAKPFDTKRLHYGDQTLWPEHCVQGTPGAALHPDLAVDLAFLILRKGMHPGIELLFGLCRGRRQDDDRAWSAAQGARGEADLRLWSRDRLLRRPFGVGRAARRLRNLRHRGRLKGDRRQQFAGRGLGADERRRGLAHPVRRAPGLAHPTAFEPKLVQ